MNRFLRLAPLLLLPMLLSECAVLGGREAEPLGEGRDRSILITVDNQEFQDATIYVRRFSSRIRLGTVIGKRTQDFEIDWVHPDIQLEVSFIAAGSFLTETLPVQPGEHLELWIMAGSAGVRR
jgi:hypothetical protein